MIRNLKNPFYNTLHRAFPTFFFVFFLLLSLLLVVFFLLSYQKWLGNLRDVISWWCMCVYVYVHCRELLVLQVGEWRRYRSGRRKLQTSGLNFRTSLPLRLEQLLRRRLEDLSLSLYECERVSMYVLKCTISNIAHCPLLHFQCLSSLSRNSSAEKSSSIPLAAPTFFFLCLSPSHPFIVFLTLFIITWVQAVIVIKQNIQLFR